MGTSQHRSPSLPANPQSLQLTATYHDRMAGLAARVSGLVKRRLSDTVSFAPNLGEALQAFVVDAVELIATGQEAAANATARYFGALALLETGEVEISGLAEDNAGFTADGRALGEALAATPAKMYLGLRTGWSLEKALAFGAFSAARLAHTETMDAARIELDHQMTESDQVRGWRWRSRGTCGACIALDSGSVREPGESLYGHPGCQCVPTPLFRVRETVTPETGHERFDALDPKEQDALLGPERAQLIRSGAISWKDLVVRQASKDWRDVLAVRPLEDLIRTE